MTIPYSLTYQERLEKLRTLKQCQARNKIALLGPRDADEQGNILPPPGTYEIIETINASGIPVKEVILKKFQPTSNHPSGGFFGAKSVGMNFRKLLEMHPTYVNAHNSMAGVYMVSFNSYRNPQWNPDYDFSHLKKEQEKYGIDHGIGGLQHFCPDLEIGLELGWGGLLDKVKHYRAKNYEKSDFYDGLENIIKGMQNWILRHSQDAKKMALKERNPLLKDNLETISKICDEIKSKPPKTFREACQWLTFFQAGAKMYNGSGEWGQLDELLRPYYVQDTKTGILTDDEAIFHIACLLLSETAYIQLGGPDADGNDLTSNVSYLILEAVHQLKTPANIGVRVGPNIDPGLLRRSVEILLEDKMGFPKFIGDKQVIEGFMKNGYSIEDSRQRIYAGCHWLAIPGREYALMDIIKIDLAKVFDYCLKKMMNDINNEQSISDLWIRFKKHLRKAIQVTAKGIDIHLKYMHEVFPELYLDLFCYGPIEKGLDASNGSLEFFAIGLDGASLATVADSFAALEQRIEKEKRTSWEEMMYHLETNFHGVAGERYRLMMKNISRFGTGGSRADMWAEKISKTFSSMVVEKPTPDGYNMIPGLFSWAKVVSYGKRLGATPDGRKAGDPVSHGPNPYPGYNRGKGGTPTQMVAAVASVQPGYGNTAPLQLDMDASIGETHEAIEKIEALIKTHFQMGGTLINVNVIDKKKILEAQRDPHKYPDLMIRVTGFSAYFASLSEELRKYVVDRIVSENQ
ncbi:MAG: pyruvate formate lyase family protein [Promethearchaeota archaeon]|jgi:formate C-acetyltransferase